MNTPHPSALDGECSEGPQIVEGGGKDWRTSELAFQHHRSEAPAGQAELLAPALAQGGTQFLRRPLGGAMVARGGTQEQKCTQAGEASTGTLFMPLERGSLVLISTSRPFLPFRLTCSFSGGRCDFLIEFAMRI